jgi:tetratricopeptide (TPR) repeat protein
VRSETRHQLKQDAFSRVTIDAAEKTVHWSVEHRAILIRAGIALVVLLAVGLGGWYFLNAQDEKASLVLTQAVRTLETPLRLPGTPAQPDSPSFESSKERAETARKQFQSIVDNYPHTRTADTARYFLGVTAAGIGDSPTAERWFKEVASHGGAEVASLAQFNLASIYADTNRTKDAVNIYQQLIAKPTDSVGKVTAQLQLAKLYQATNQPLDAKRLYEEIKKANATNEAGSLASQKLAELK